MVGHLLAVVGIDEQPSQNCKTNEGILLTFKKGIKQCFDRWWREKKSEGGKLDFYFKHKGAFGYEEYLDSLPRHIRMYITRLRTSSHNFPIETLRYKKNKPARAERRCDVCSLGEMGDELHYLLRCENIALQEIRLTFLSDIKKQIPRLDVFSAGNIIQYCLQMTDKSIHRPMALYVKRILLAYRAQKGHIPAAPTKTRSGRLVKKPEKLNL